jgi:uncharacterized damage-inducible protein DinB
LKSGPKASRATAPALPASRPTAAIGDRLAGRDIEIQPVERRAMASAASGTARYDAGPVFTRLRRIPGMTKRFCAVFVATLATLTTPAWAAAAGQQPAGTHTPPKNALVAKRPAGVRGEVQQVLDDAEQKLTALASVVPPGKFSWRPAPGVRSFGEAFLHIAGGNYELGALWGMKPPPNLDLKKIEQQGADQGNVVAAMRVSFQRVRESIAGMSDADLDRQIDFFGRPATVRMALLHTLAHANEHLGQVIAYARMNGIVPPWTAAENKAIAADAAKNAPPKKP